MDQSYALENLRAEYNRIGHAQELQDDISFLFRRSGIDVSWRKWVIAHLFLALLTSKDNNTFVFLNQEFQGLELCFSCHIR